MAWQMQVFPCLLSLLSLISPLSLTIAWRCPDQSRQTTWQQQPWATCCLASPRIVKREQGNEEAVASLPILNSRHLDSFGGESLS
ncbi:hypothetical protein V8C26DRAFT_397744 [Trichoderma gracile]